MTSGDDHYILINRVRGGGVSYPLQDPGAARPGRLLYVVSSIHHPLVPLQQNSLKIQGFTPTTEQPRELYKVIRGDTPTTEQPKDCTES